MFVRDQKTTEFLQSDVVHAIAVVFFLNNVH